MRSDAVSEMQFAPAIHPTLIRVVWDLDDGNEVIAAIWRRLGRRARREQLLQPSYESVRRLVHAQRAWRRLMALRVVRAALLTAGLLVHTHSRYRAARSRAPASAVRSPSGTASPRGGP
jgi:hypothetical protein